MFPTTEQTKDAALDMLRDLLSYHETEVLKLRMALSLLDGTVSEIHQSLENEGKPIIKEPITYKVTAINKTGQTIFGEANNVVEGVVKDNIEITLPVKHIDTVEPTTKILPRECDSDTFIRLFNEYLKEAKVTQKSIADKLNLHFSNVSAFARGKQKTVSIIQRYATLLGVKITEYNVPTNTTGKRTYNKREPKSKTSG